MSQYFQPLHPHCISCQKTRIAQKDGPKGENGNLLYKKSDFIVPCKGIPADYNYIPNYEKIKHKIQNTDEEYLKAIYDPVTWAKIHVNWEPRSSKDGIEYQALPLRCTSKRKVLRWGRRLGKCIQFNTDVLTDQGPIPIQDLHPGLNKICTLNVETGKLEWTSNFTLNDNGDKETLKLKTRLGSVNYPTHNHPYYKLTENGLDWVEAQDLKPGDRIAIPKGYNNLFSNEVTDRNLFRLLGYLISDGGTNYKSAVRFSNASIVTLDDLSKIINKYNCELSFYGGVDYGIKAQKGFSNKVLKICRDFNIQMLAINKKIPKQILGASNGDVGEFLGAAWDCDGWITNDEFGYCSASYALASGVKHLLKRFNINATISHKRVKYNGGRNDAWVVGIYNLEDKVSFIHNIKLLAKKEKAEKIVEMQLSAPEGKTWLRTFPKEFHSILDRALNKAELTYYQVRRTLDDRQRRCAGPSYRKVYELNQKIQDKDIQHLLDSDILFDEIVSIEPNGIHKTYDLTVPETHNFVGNDIISHNTDTMSIAILHYLFTNSPMVKRWDSNQGKFVDGFSTVLVLAPYLSQIKLIFDRLNKLISTNNSMQNEVKRNVANPYHIIELYNGAKVVGFPSGAKSGSGAESVRGQKADFIVLDETDYLNIEDLDNIIALLMEHADVSLLAASTPSGRREHFWNFCMERMDFKEYYFPSMVNPSWSQAMEMELKEFYQTQTAWKHEILAEFGESETGVFQNEFVSQALDDYRFDNISYNKDRIYSIGVDWNDYINGTKLYVIELDVDKGIFRTVERASIEKAGWTQTTSISKLIELNRKWRPSFIYVDEGYGAVQIELLKKHGMEAELRGDKVDAFLKNVKGVNLSSKIVLFDPLTQQPTKEWIKPYMVNNAVRRFEQGQAKISVYDDQLLYKQLIGYNVAKVSMTGMPVYEASKDGDHDLDAYMLALLGFTEMSEFTKIKSNGAIAIAGKFGENTAQTELMLARVLNREPDWSKVNASKKTKDINNIPQGRNAEIQGNALTQYPSIATISMGGRTYTHEAFNSDRKNAGLPMDLRKKVITKKPRRSNF